jgi:hypothetical protein
MASTPLIKEKGLAPMMGEDCHPEETMTIALPREQSPHNTWQTGLYMY